MNKILPIIAYMRGKSRRNIMANRNKAKIKVEKKSKCP
jgi:hypothetical protein